MPTGKFPEKITYWAPDSENEYGVASFSDPIHINGRWEDRAELVRSPSGDEFTSKSVVFLDTDIQPDGYIARGHVETANPHEANGQEVRTVARVRNMRHSDQEIKVYL